MNKAKAGKSQILVKVLQVIPSLSFIHGGPSRAIQLIESALAGAGLEVTTLTTDDDGPGRRVTPENREISNNNGVSRVYVRKWHDLYKFAPGALTWLWRNIRRFDVVHIHALFSFTSICAAFVARARDVPYILRPLGTLNAYGLTKRRSWAKKISLMILEGPLIRHAAAIHFTSIQEEVEANLLGIPMRGAVVPLAVDIDSVQARDPRTPVPMRTVLFLSRIDPVKNIEGLLRAWVLVRQSLPSIRLVIAGDGPTDYVSNIKSVAEGLGLKAHIEWPGHVAGIQKTAMLKSADIFVLPSFSENFGIAAAEALAAGIPCVLTHGVAIAHGAKLAAAARVVGTEPTEIASALIDLLSDPESCHHMGLRGRRYAEKEFSKQTMAARLVGLYQEVCSSNRAEA